MKHCRLIPSALLWTFFCIGCGLPAAQGAVDWEKLMPERLKTPVPIELSRNPCQPTVPVAAPLPLRGARDKDELTPLVQAALAGRIRSVVRGPVPPLVLIGTRLVRPGEEWIPGPEFNTACPGGGASAGNSAAQATRTLRLRLKTVGQDRLTWMAELPGENPREVICWLEPFLREVRP